MASQTEGKFKVFITQPVPNETLSILKDNDVQPIVNQSVPIDRSEFLNRIKNVDGIFCTVNERIDKEVLDAAGKNLKVIATCSTGYDHIELKECTSRNIQVGYTPGVRSATAEFTVAMLLNASRKLEEGMNAARKGEWQSWNLMWKCGKGLKNSTVGIFGLGRIGLAIAQRLSSFEVKKIIYNDVEKKKEGDEYKLEFVSFEELLKQSDFLICSCVASPDTVGVFDKQAFHKMKKEAIFVNVSRGVCVNQDDLYEVLNNNVISAAALDVTDPEPLPKDNKLYKLENCFITPHMASAEINTRLKMARMTAENIVNALQNKPLVCQVPKEAQNI